MNRVCKWGGSSLACGTKILNVCKFIKAKNIRHIILSAPGKRYKGDTKITDLLILAAKNSAAFDNLLKEVFDRYQEIVTTLKIDFDLQGEFFRIKDFFLKTQDTSYLYSRGEYLLAKIVATYLDYTFVDSKDIIKFDKNGKLLATTYKLIQEKASKHKAIVIPGFYGSYKNKIKIFSRGGSDISGAIVAKALNLDYNNYTDVDGIYNTYPITKESQILPAISYSDMKFLGLFGFGVLHHKCCDILRDTSLTIHLKNTFNPLKCGSKVQNAPPLIFASSKITMLLAFCEGDIRSLLKVLNIYVYLQIFYQDKTYYLLDKSAQDFLTKRGLNSTLVEVEAIVSAETIPQAIPLGNNHYLALKKAPIT